MTEASTKTVAEDVAAGLRRHGVEIVFAQSIPSALLLATPKFGIRQVSYRTENAGGAMADGYARLSGKPGIVCAQNGPAATLLVAPLAEALKASVPVIALVQDVGAATRGRNAFQEIDHFQLFAGCTKSILRLDDPTRVDDLLDAAFTSACSGRPGPVVLLLPKDLLSTASLSENARTASLGYFPLDRTRPDADRVAKIAALLASAERPLIVAGGGVHSSGASPQVAAIQEQLSIPVGTTNMGKGAVDERHELSLGVIGNAMGTNSRTHFLRTFVKQADVVLLVGTRTNENGTDAWRLFGDETRFVHLDVDSVEIGRNYESLRLVGDAKLGLADLLEATRGLDLAKRSSERAQVAAEIAEAHRLYRDQASPQTTSGESPIRPERVVSELDQLLTDDMIVVTDASYSTLWMTNYLTSQKVGQRFVSPRGLAGLGWGLPLALGAKLAQPEARVVCLVGDGGFAHVWSELETAVRSHIPLTLVVFNNGILGFQKHAELYSFGAHTTAINFAPVDHTMIARACGAQGVRVDDPGELSGVLAKALESDEVTLIEVMTAPDAYPPITLWEGHDAQLLGAS
jgi:acetolactate synthase-1/2/3 large subunit